MKLVAAIAFVASALSATAHATEPVPDQWLPVQRLIGNWAGVASGEGGDGTVTRRNAFVMGGRFIHETNTTTYPPQERNKAGEVHEHWGVFSFDKARKTLVLRQFHMEGFVNTYRRSETSAASSAKQVFDSESFENFSNSWKARETYEFVSDDEIIETFELASPDKPFQLYSRNHFKRSPP